MSAADGSPATLMVIDDEPANLKLMESILRPRGYQVRSFPGGRLALEAAALQPPDLILLDVTLPELDGYQICERLKADAKLSLIPVIFLSALRETADKVKAFRCGGVDFISKPFQVEEVYARVETHLELHALQRSLAAQNERLESTVADRTRELAAAHARLKALDQAKGDFLAIISHELRTPLNGILAVSEMVLGELPASPESMQLTEIFEESRDRILALLDDALLLTQIDVSADRMESAAISLKSVLSIAVERSAAHARSRRVALLLPRVELLLVRGQEELLVRALSSLLETALKLADESRAVRLNWERVEDRVFVFIDSDGKILEDGLRRQFFEVFSVRESNTPGSAVGLGPSVARRILSLFGGSVTIANRGDSGTRLTVSLRLAPQ